MKTTKTMRKTTFVSILIVAVMALVSLFTAGLNFSDVNGVAEGGSAPVVWGGSADTATVFSGGSGTSGDPYKISNGAELALLSGLVNRTVTKYNGTPLAEEATDGAENDYLDFNSSSVHYIMTANIVLNDTTNLNVWSEGLRPKTEWTAIGTNVSVQRFAANFDGCGFKVSGIFIYKLSINYQGLFGYVFGGIIKNLGVEKSVIKGGTFIGGIAGRIDNGGSITSCYNAGTVSGSGNYAAGIAGNISNATISDCDNYGVILGNSDSGGIAGSGNGSIINCYNTGIVSGSSYLGGITGRLTAGVVAGCGNEGVVNGTSSYVGGVAGSVQGTISNSYNSASVSGTMNVGGVSGGISVGGSVKNCSNTGSVTSTYASKYATSDASNVGGVTGAVLSGTMANCYNRGAVTGTTDTDAYVNIGGVAGYTHNATSTVTNCYNTGSVVVNGSGGTVNRGGVVGLATGVSVNNGYFLQTISINNGIDAVGSGTGTTAIFNTSGVITANSGITNITTTTNSTTILDVLNAWVNTQNASAPDPLYTVWSGKPYPKFETPETESGESGIWNGSVATKFAGGSGTNGNPYQISNGAELAYLASLINADNATYNANTVYYKLTANIVLNDTASNGGWENWGTAFATEAAAKASGVKVWTAIGNNSNSFTANFDGNDLKVQGIYINKNSNYQGLFGYVVGKVSNVGVENSYIKGKHYVGGVAGSISDGSLTDCYNSGIVSGSGVDVGGVAGYISGGSLTDCYNSGIVSGSGVDVGGVAGSVSYYTRLSNCYNTGTVTGGENYVGGVAGNVGNSSITNSYNTGTVTGGKSYSYVGGVAGSVGGSITNSYNEGTVTGGESYVGGVAGYVGGSVTNCYNEGTVTGGESYVGGVAGQVNTGGSLTNCYNTGAVLGTGSSTGGIAGSVTSGSVEYCYFLTGKITISETIQNPSQEKGIGTGSGTTAVFDTSGNFAVQTNVYGNNLTLLTALNAWVNSASNTVGAYVWEGTPYPTLNSIVWNGTTATKFAGGDGSSGNPYQISNGAELAYLASLINAGNATYNANTVYYKLTANIVLNDTTLNGGWANWGTAFATEAEANTAGVKVWTAIGTGATGSRFAANFDGAGFEVKGIYINNLIDNQGLFGYVTVGNIFNVGVAESYIKGNEYIGGVAGRVAVNGSIINSYNSGNISGTGKYVGGIVGQIQLGGSVTNSYNTGAVRGTYNVGGVAGSVENSSSVKNSYNTGAITSANYTGGVVGTVYSGGTIANCYNIGSISRTETGVETTAVGGIAGEVGENGSATNNVENCYFLTGKITINSVLQTSGNEKAIGKTSGSGLRTTAVFNTSGVITANSGISGITVNTTTLLTALNAWRTSASGGNNSADYVIWTGTPYPTLNFNIWNGSTATAFSGGSGTSSNPYLISNGAELAYLASLINTGNATYNANTVHYKLTANIVLNDTTSNGGWENWGTFVSETAANNAGLKVWTAIGKYISMTDDTDSFKANFDGNNYTVSGIYINKTGTNTINDNYQGLFGYVYGGTIKNVGVEESYIKGYQNIGGVAGQISGGNITNCYNTGIVSGSGYSVGGIAGFVYSGGNISNCYNTGNVSGTETSSNTIGGIAGYVSGGNITNCYNTGIVSGSSYSVGGIAGLGFGSLTNCYNTGAVSGSSKVGGIAGNITQDITNCYNTGTISGSSNNIGGIAGELSGTSRSITNSYNTGEVSGNDNVGGIAGLIDGNIANSYNTGIVSGSRYSVGGIAGYITGDITNSYNTGAIDAGKNVNNKSSVGGVAGGITGNITNSYNTGAISGTGNYVGGIAGLIYGNITNCYNSGEISGTSSYVGGIAGELSGASRSITNSYNTGEVSGNDNVGGIAGSIDSGNITDSYNTGAVSGTGASSYSIGGIAGIIDSGNIENCYNTGTVSGKYNVGGITGGISGNITNCYNTGNVSGTGSFVGGIAGDNSGNITNCYNTGNVTCSGDRAGGIVGNISTAGSSISNCYNAGSVTGSYYIGGVVGNTENSSIIKNCYNIGNVTGSITGGIAGYFSGSISNCYNMGSVVGNDNYTGGIAGMMSGNMTNCYNTGTVSGIGFVGGIAGEVAGTSSSIKNSYNTGVVSGNTTKVGGIAGNLKGSITNSYNTGAVSGGSEVGGIAGNVTSDGLVVNCYFLTGKITINGVLQDNTDEKEEKAVGSGNTSTSCFAFDNKGKFLSGEKTIVSGVTELGATDSVMTALNLWCNANAEGSAHFYYVDTGANLSNAGALKYAFTERNYYFISFDLNDGSSTTPSTLFIIEGGRLTEPAEPTREGYDFGGWWTSDDGGSTLISEWDFSLDTASDEITLYAKWNIPKTYIYKIEKISGNYTVTGIYANEDNEIYPVGTAGMDLAAQISAIAADAEGNDLTIQFGSGGTDVLDIGTSSLTLATGTGGFNSTQTITLTGSITSAINSSAQGTVTIDGAKVVSSANIANTNASGSTVDLKNNGVLTISGGTVQTTKGVAIYNVNSGAINISGGTVQATGDGGDAIYNASAGAINISGGTVSATTGRAIYNNMGLITINETNKITNPTLITSANETASEGTIYLNKGTANNNIFTISGGVVENTAASANGRAIYNNNAGTVNISGGTVSATTGYVVWNASTGAVTISGGTVSATTGNAIYNHSTGAVNISGGTVSATTGYALYNNATGAVNISGGTVSATMGVAIYNASTGQITVSQDAGKTTLVTSTNTTSAFGTIYICASTANTILKVTGGTVENTAENGNAIYNFSTARISISGGTVQNTSTGKAIYNNLTGTLTISGGTVSATTGYAIYNHSTGTLTISGGTVSATTGVAIYNNSTGRISISETNKTTNPTLITSANETTGEGTIYLKGGTAGTAILTISGGVIENKTVSTIAKAIYNAGAGKIEITGGEVSATYGYAVYNLNAGALNISGGTVSATYGYAIYNALTGALNISGGTVSATTGYAIYNLSTGVITISETNKTTNPTLITSANVISEVDSSSGKYPGTVYLGDGQANTTILTMTGGVVENTADSANGRTIYNANVGKIEITGGTVQAKAGRAIYNNSTGAITISGGTVSATTGGAIYNGSTGAVTISEADSAKPTKITSANETNNVGSGKYPGTIYLVNANTAPRLVISGGTVENTAANANGRAIHNAGAGAINISGGTVRALPSSGTYASNAIYNASTGAINISGGTVSATSGRAIHNQSTGAVTISGGTVSSTTYAVYNYANGTIILGKDPVISGTMYYAAGKLSVDITETANKFVPGTKEYSIELSGTLAAGNVAVVGGKDFLSSFIIINLGYSLVAGTDNSGTDGSDNSGDIVLDPYTVAIGITAGTLTGGTYNTSGYSVTISASTVSGTIAYSVSNGALPTGLSLDTSTGVISGTPSAGGTFTFKIKALNSSNGVMYDEKEFSITIAAINGTGGGVSVSGWEYGVSAATPSVTTVTKGDYTSNTVYYSSDNGSTWIAWNVTAPSNAGTYKIKVVYTATANYNALTVNGEDFTITKKAIARPGDVTGLTYSGSVQGHNITTNSGYSIAAAASNGALSATNAGTYYVTVTLDSNHEWSTGTDKTEVLTLSWVIAKKAVTVSGFNSSKEYDGTTAVTGTLALSDVVGTEVVTVSGVYDNKNVGTDKALTFTLGGANKNNYTITATYTAAIAAKTLTVTATAQTITYGDSISQTAYTVTGFIEGESTANVTITGAPTLTASRTTAGTGTVSVSSVSLMSAANYEFIKATTTAVLTINKATLTVTATAQTITYGGSILQNAYEITGFKNSETANVVSGTPTLTASGALTVAAGGTVSVTSVTGMSADNYIFQKASGSAAITVTRATLTVTATAQTITYGGTISQTAYTVTGFKNSETASVVTGSPTLTAAGTLTVAAGGTVSVTSVSGMSAANYTFEAATTTAVLTINKATLTVTAAAQTITYGDSISQTAYTVTGFITGETAINVTITGAPTLTAAGALTVAGGGTVSVSSVSGMSAENYTFQAASGSAALTVNRAALTVTATAQTITYGDNISQTAYEITGFKNSETASVVTGSPTLTASRTTVGTGTISVSSVSGMSAANYTITAASGTAALTVNRATLTITATAQTITYGGTISQSAYTITGYKNDETASIVTGSPTLTASRTAAGTGTISVSSVSGMSAANYTFEAATTTAVLTINKATLTVTATAQTITYGDSILQTAYEITGFKNSETASVVTGEPTLTASRTTAGTGTISITDVSGMSADNYTFVAATGTAALTINKAMLTVTATAQTITYGDSISQTAYEITGFKNSETASVVTGSPTLTASRTTVGTGTISVSSVSGMSADNYTFEAATTTAILTVNTKAITAAMFTAITAVTYTGSALTPAVQSTTLTLTTDYTVVSYSSNTNAGTASVSVTGTGNYSGTITLNFTINKADLTTVTVEVKSDVTVYTHSSIEHVLDISAMFGTTEVSGTLTVTDWDEKTAGTNQNFAWTFTPDSDNFSAVTGTLTGVDIISDVLVNLILTVPPTKTAYTAFDEFDPDGMTLTAVFDSGETLILDASDYTVTYATSGNTSFRFGETMVTLSYTADGITLTVDITVTVAKRQVAVANPTYSGGTLTFGDSLPAISGTTTGGSYTLNSNQTLTAGTKNYNWTFTPTDTVNNDYTNLTGTISLTVAKKQVAVANPTYSGGTLTFGDSLPAISGTTTGGSYALNSNQTLTAGTKNYNWTFTPTDTANNEYTNLTGTISLTVAKKQVAVANPTYSGGTLTFGDSLPAISGTTTGGSYALNSNQTLTAGTKNYNWTFTPTDTVNNDYTNLTGTISLTVVKANQTAPSTLTASAITQNSITLGLVTGAEYKLNNGDWQTSNVFLGLTAGTEYTFYIRMAANTNYNESPATERKFSTLAVVVPKIEEEAPAILEDLLEGIFDGYEEGDDLPTPDAPDGFKFTGWKDADGNFVESITDMTENTELTAVWGLETPDVSLSGSDNENGGKVLTASHTKYSNVTYTYQWFIKDGETWKVLDGKTNETLTVYDNGEYRCEVTAKAGNLTSVGYYSSVIDFIKTGDDKPASLTVLIVLLAIVIILEGAFAALCYMLTRKNKKGNVKINSVAAAPIFLAAVSGGSIAFVIIELLIIIGLGVWIALMFRQNPALKEQLAETAKVAGEKTKKVAKNAAVKTKKAFSAVKTKITKKQDKTQEEIVTEEEIIEEEPTEEELEESEETEEIEVFPDKLDVEEISESEITELIDEDIKADNQTDTEDFTAEEKAAESGEIVIDEEIKQILDEADKEREAFVEAKKAGAAADIPQLQFTLSREDVLDYIDDMAKNTERFPVLVNAMQKSKKHYCDTMYCGKWCFGLMYERSNVIKFTLRMDEEFSATVDKNHTAFKSALFPKGTGWYDLIVDSSFGGKKEVFDILNNCYDFVLKRYYSLENQNYITDVTAAKADAETVIKQVKDNEKTQDPAFDLAIVEREEALQKYRAKNKLNFKMTRKRMLLFANANKELTEGGAIVVEREKRYMPASLKIHGKTYALVYEKAYKEKADDGTETIKTYVSLTVRISDAYAEWLAYRHPEVCRARFPKNRNWYIVPVDGSFPNAQMIYRVLKRAKKFIVKTAPKNK